MTNTFKKMEKEMEKAGYVTCQMFLSGKWKDPKSFSPTERKIVRKIESINSKISLIQKRISALREQLKQLEEKRVDLQDVCFHPIQSTEYGPKKDAPLPPVVRSTCNLCMKDLTQ